MNSPKLTPPTIPAVRSRRSSGFKRLTVALWVLLLTGCGQVELYSNLKEREANQMMAILLERGIPCTKEAGDEELTWKLLVSKDDFSQSVNLLTATGYPNDHHDRMGDVFQKSGLVSSPTEDRIRYVYALSEELAETISRIDGVVDARVHVVLPNNDPFSGDVKPSSASVYIKHRADSDLSASRAEIKDLVAKSIEGLESGNIEVFMDDVEPITPPTAVPASYSHVLGVKLDSNSVKQFWLVVGGLIFVAAVNLALVLWFVFRTHWTSSTKTEAKDPSRQGVPAVSPA